MLPTWPVSLQEAGALRKQRVVWCPWLQHGSVWSRGRRPHSRKPRERTGCWVPPTAPAHLPASGIFACTLGACVTGRTSLGGLSHSTSLWSPKSWLRGLLTSPPTSAPGAVKCRPGWAPRAGRQAPARSPCPGVHGWGPLVQARGPSWFLPLSPRHRHRLLALSSVLSDGPLLGRPPKLLLGRGEESLGWQCRRWPGPDTRRLSLSLALQMSRARHCPRHRLQPKPSWSSGEERTSETQVGLAAACGRRSRVPRRGTEGAVWSVCGESQPFVTSGGGGYVCVRDVLLCS